MMVMDSETEDSFERVFKTNNYHITNIIEHFEKEYDMMIATILHPSSDPLHTAHLLGRAQYLKELLDKIKH